MNRGWKVTIATTNNMKRFINAVKAPRINFLNLGRCSVTEQFDDLMRNAASVDFQSGSALIFQWINSLHPCMYNGLVQSIFGGGAQEVADAAPVRPHDFGVVIFDVTTTAGYDIANALRIPSIINNADLMYILPPRILPPVDYIPPVFSGKSVHQMGTAFVERLLMPPIRFLLRGIIAATHQREMNAFRHQSADLLAREQQTGASLNVFTMFDGKVVLQNTAFGLEYARPVGPTVQMVGPCLFLDARKQALSVADQQWMDKAGTDVVFVNMGTIAKLTAKQIANIFFGVSSPDVRVLWKLSKDQQQMLPLPLHELPVSFKVVDWVSSQNGVLLDKHTKVFLSHCGINSAHETMLLAGGRVRLLCLPLFGDQMDMAMRVKDAGVGLLLDKDTFTAEDVTTQLRTLLREEDGDSNDATTGSSSSSSSIRPSFLRNGEAVKRAIEMTGGTSRAVDWIEYVHAHGVYTSLLVPHEQTLPEWAWFNLDVYIVWTLSALVAWTLLRRVGRWCWCSKAVGGGKGDHNKKNR